MISSILMLLTAGDLCKDVATARSFHVYHYFNKFPDVLLKRENEEALLLK